MFDETLALWRYGVNTFIQVNPILIYLNKKLRSRIWSLGGTRVQPTTVLMLSQTCSTNTDHCQFGLDLCSGERKVKAMFFLDPVFFHSAFSFLLLFVCVSVKFKNK